MKGHPLRELCLVLITGFLLLVPLRMLTCGTPSRPPAPAEAETDPQTVTQMTEAWLDMRFSHPPEDVRVMQGDKLLWKGGGSLREDGDLELEGADGQAELELRLVWPEEIPQAYAEFTLEPVGEPARSIGFWGSGTMRRSWNVGGESRP